MKPWEAKDNDLLLTKKEAVFIDDERRRLAEENTKLRGDLQKMHWQLTLMQCKLENNGIDIPFPPQTKPLKRLNKQEIARYMFSQNTGQDIGQMLIEYFCDKNGLTLEYIED